ncbi:MAG: protein kinase [Polyangiales bacterium]
MSEPGAAQNTDDILSPGEDFGRYRVVRRLGRGGMGEVYEATHATLGKRVALKVLRPEVAQNPKVLARFQREGAAVARVEHPNVVDIFDVGVERDVAFLVMEFLEGEDLGAMLRREGALEVSRAVDILLPVLAAVAAAHAEGVIHRDLKPANVFLATTKLGVVTPKVLDFGVSKILDGPSFQNITGPTTLLGTPYYLPPELARGARNADPRSDQYALGVILYQCLTDRRPFAGATLYDTLRAIVHGEYEPAHVVRPSLPREVADAVARALSREPERRFASVLEFGSALIPFASRGVRALWGRVFGLTADIFSEVATRPEIALHLFEPAHDVPASALASTPPSLAPPPVAPAGYASIAPPRDPPTDPSALTPPAAELSIPAPPRTSRLATAPARSPSRSSSRPPRCSSRPRDVRRRPRLSPRRGRSRHRPRRAWSRPRRRPRSRRARGAGAPRARGRGRACADPGSGGAARARRGPDGAPRDRGGPW